MLNKAQQKKRQVRLEKHLAKRKQAQKEMKVRNRRERIAATTRRRDNLKALKQLSQLRRALVKGIITVEEFEKAVQ